jgi:hypothetical protein
MAKVQRTLGVVINDDFLRFLGVAAACTSWPTGAR